MAADNCGALGWSLDDGEVQALETAADAVGFEFSGGGGRRAARYRRPYVSVARLLCTCGCCYKYRGVAAPSAMRPYGSAMRVLVLARAHMPMSRYVSHAHMSSLALSSSHPL
eukprot:scaffold1090_cov135-Isochrysis_galbana.AAC.10